MENGNRVVTTTWLSDLYSTTRIDYSNGSWEWARNYIGRFVTESIREIVGRVIDPGRVDQEQSVPGLTAAQTVQADARSRAEGAGQCGLGGTLVSCLSGAQGLEVQCASWSGPATVCVGLRSQAGPAGAVGPAGSNGSASVAKGAQTATGGASGGGKDRGGVPSLPDCEDHPGYSSFGSAKRGMGPTGEDGYVYDHIVEQSQEGKSGFNREDINNPCNMAPAPSWANQARANYYNSKPDFTQGLRVRDWLAQQEYSFEEQRQFGLDILGRILRGDNLN
ncbi:hypothetical protein [Microbacterium sp. T32]|uniref:hypothetical protein n=1 Tax=Microbacterium sp. T32 TaxID=1776083 RepID=UPI000B147E70|nr:hypothetical protein [Microbacterium sp. T32]